LLSDAAGHARQDGWPLDTSVTQHIFSFLPPSELPHPALTCSFFYCQTLGMARRKLNALEKRYGIDSSWLPVAAPHVQLQFAEIFMRPIACDVQNYAPKICREYTFGKKDIQLLTVCTTKETGTACVIATIALPARTPDLFNVFQFVTGTDEDGHVFISPFSEEEIELVVDFEHCHQSVEHTDRIKSFLQNLYGLKIHPEAATIDDLSLCLFNTHPSIHNIHQQNFNEVKRGEIFKSAKKSTSKKCVIL
jgi:hypothetical protein